MIESYFGSGSPMWSGVPTPALGWFPLQVPLGTRPFGGAANGMTSPQTAQGTSPGIAAGLQSPQMSNALPSEAFGFGIGPLPFTQPPIVSVPSLLAAVAQRRGQPLGPATDQEIEDFIYDALEWLNGAGDVEVRCEGARVTLSGSVQHKRLKRDVGEITWAIPGVNDVQNNIAIAARRRSRQAARDSETQAVAPGRKQG